MNNITKSEILKLAGVKNAQELYNKFKTEKEFLAKYGKKLKKANVGRMIGGEAKQASSFTPMSYSDLYADATSAVTGISPQEQARREGLASQQAIANASSQKGGGGIGDILGSIDPSMIASLVGGAKNGKRLKKAADGFMGSPFQGMPNKPTSFSVPSDPGFNTNVSSNPYMSGSLIGGQKAQSSSGSWASNPYIDSPFKASQSTPSSSGFDWKGTLGKISPALAMQAGPLIGVFEQIEQGKKDLAEAKKYGKVSDVVLQAQNSKPERIKNRYVRPEDNLVQNINPLGTGTNYLQAENGAEIQNTYAPNVMYTNLGYEPLNDSNVKQYKKGGKLKKAEGGINLDPFAGIAGSLGGSLGSATKKGSGKGGPASTIGSILGGIAGSFIPIPGVGTALGSLAGGFIGGLFDGDSQNELQAAQDKTNENMQAMAFQKGVRGTFNQYSANAKNGGWVSHDWQPQVIASFGEHSMEDLLAPDPMMDTLRAGGHLKHYTAPSENAMYTGRDLPYQMEDGGQMAMGGDLQVHRGKAETLSYNPYLPNNGETVMFRGPSHDDGGMPISYGNNGVEVEGGEPAQVMKDGGTQDNLVVFGNMHIPDYGANEIGDPKAKGMKFKRYIADLSKQEAKQNKIIAKSTDLVNNSNTDDPFELLSFNSGKAMNLGASTKLKSLADKKMNTAAVQNAILETAEEYGIDSAKLANKQVAAFGGKFSADMFHGGGKKSKISPNYKYFPNTANTRNEVDANLLLDPDTQTPYSTPEITDVRTMSQVIPDAFAKPANSTFVPTKKDIATTNNTDWASLAQAGLNSAYPFLRPTAARPLDPSQLAPEYLAASLNQLEPVQAQLYNPMLTQATSISLQDQLNEITAQTRDAMRLAQGDASALSIIASQASQAKNKVLAEQFRMNQAEKQRIAEQNASVLNDAQLKNLSLLDQQYVRQSQAKSNTKQQAIEVAKSIADKIAKNKLENRQQITMENLYPDYSFTPEGRAYKNPFTQAVFNYSGIGSSKSGYGDLQEGKAFSYNKAGKIIGTHSTKKDDGEAKNGKIVKAFKNF